jgi:hypothetical protein
MNSFDYISENFLTLEQLSEVSGVSVEMIIIMIEKGCLPSPSYKISGTCEVTSFFGVHSELISRWYFPRAYVEQVNAISSDPRELETVAQELQEAFLSDYKQCLHDMQAKEGGLAHLFHLDRGLENENASNFLNAEWQHYLDGTYGVCTKTASVQQIAIKEIMIARIKQLVEKAKRGLENDERLDLTEAVDALDRVSAEFAPHELERSSRYKYIDLIKRAYLS